MAGRQAILAKVLRAKAVLNNVSVRFSLIRTLTDDHGNMVKREQYGYAIPWTTPPLLRTFTYNYTGYPGRHIWNRLSTVQMQKAGGSPVTLVTNTYDVYAYSAAPQVAFPAMLRQHDTANYGTSNIQRGNVKSSVSMGRTISLTYDYTGNVLATSDGYGHTASQIMDENRNYVVPKTTSGGSLQTSMSWNSYNAPVSATGPNSDTMSFNYDFYARPVTRTDSNGRVSNMTYGTSAPYWSKATTGTRWSTSWVDGFGRPYKTESGYGATTVSVTDTEYAPCACSPLGKLFRTSLPHAPGATPLWTEYYYDALGRTVEVRQPNGAGSTTTLYTGAVTKVTDPAGKWKQMETDALGNLINVTEPRPNGAGAVDTTTYTYSEFGKLLTVTMPRPGMGVGNASTVTQTRTWVYDSMQRLTSVTHPESGTTSYLYNGDGSAQKKTDAKGQWIAYSYDTDGRVTAARKYLANGTETCGSVVYSYGTQSFDSPFTQNAAGRLAATETGCLNEGPGKLIEMYSYNAAGAVTKKRLRILRGYGSAAVDRDVAYGYGTGGKLSTVLYPGATVPYTYSYDDMERPIKMTGPSMFNGTQIDHVKDVVYGVAGQVTSMKYLAGETIDQTVGGVEYTVPAYFTENKTYNAFYQLTRQTVGSLVDLEYKFSPDKNNGRITGRKNYNSEEEVVYEYDELNRLIKASATGGGGWSQSFVHDGFGNLREQKVNSGVAPAVMLNVNMSNNRLSDSGWTYDGTGNTLSMPVVGGGTAGMAYDVDNRLATWTKTGTGAVESYGYLADNKRVWKKMPNGTEYYYFYGAGGQKLLTYMVSSLSPFTLGGGPAANVYFGGKLIRADGIAVVHDRLGSVVARGNCGVGCSGATAKDYFPYGEEIGTATAGNQDKFGTYHRDSTSGLDYADQRYFGGTGAGRFLTSDPSGQGGNWYTYAGGDPVNFTDPNGLAPIYAFDYSLESSPFSITVTASRTQVPLMSARGYSDYMALERSRQEQIDNMFGWSTARPAPPGRYIDPDSARIRATGRLAEVLNNPTCASLFNAAAAGFSNSTEAVLRVWETLQTGGQINGVRLNLSFNSLPIGSVEVTRSSGGQAAFITMNLNATQWNESVVYGDDYMFAVLVHELGHVFDALYGEEGSSIVTPDVRNFDDSLSIENNYRVDKACFGGNVYGARP